MERSVWTDERITDMVVRVDKSIDSLREEMRAGFDRMDEGFESIRRELLHVVLVMSGMLVTVLVTVLAKSF